MYSNMNINTAQYGYGFVFLTIILGHVSGLPQTVAINYEDLSLEHDEGVQVNMSRGLVKILNRMEKLEDELCEKKVTLAHLEEQIKLCNSTRDADRKYSDLNLSMVVMNLTSARNNAQNAMIEKTQKFCHKAGSTLGMVNLSTGSYFFSGEIKRNWFNAFTYCRSHGLELLSIESPEENAAIINTINNFGDKQSYWMSGTDQGEEGKWVWMSTGQNIEYNAWLSPQPDNYKGAQHCNLLWNLSNGISWDDGSCNGVLKFVCELQETCKL